jgi:hypothetical protein
MDIAKDQVRALRTRKAKQDGEDEGRGQGEDVTLIDVSTSRCGPKCSHQSLPLFARRSFGSLRVSTGVNESTNFMPAAYGISNEIWLVRAIPLNLGDLRAVG